MVRSNRFARVCALASAISIAAYVWVAAVTRVWIDPLSLTVFMTSTLEKLTLSAIALTLGAGLRLALSDRQTISAEGGWCPTLALAFVAVALGIVGASLAWWETRPGQYLYDGPEPVPLQTFAQHDLKMSTSLFVGFGAAWILKRLRRR